jgi:hypothetical protein
VVNELLPLIFVAIVDVIYYIMRDNIMYHTYIGAQCVHMCMDDDCMSSVQYVHASTGLYPEHFDGTN